MIKSIWKLFLAIIATPVKANTDSDCVVDVRIMHFYPIPEDIKEYSKEEIGIYAKNLAQFILEKYSLESNKFN